jgi:integrase
MARREYRSGSLWLRGQRFYLRFYQAGKQKAVFLCVKDDLHHSPTCSVVRKLAKEKLATLGVSNPSRDGMKVSDFWNQTYEPHVRQNWAPSTLHSYTDLWERFIEPRFGKMDLGEVRTHQLTEFLTGLSSRLNTNSIKHLRTLLSGIFSHACSTGKIPVNPVRDCKVLTKPRPVQETKAYTLEHLEQIVNALSANPKAQLVVMLCSLQGLRPSEVNGLKWENCDFENSALHLRQSWVLGQESQMKTTSSKASIPLLSPVFNLLQELHRAQGSPLEGWVFPARTGVGPFNIKSFIKKQIIPVLRAASVPWFGLYAGRRGAASILTELTGDPIASSLLLRHDNISTTMTRYIKADRRQLVSGMKLLEEKLNTSS